MYRLRFLAAFALIAMLAVPMVANAQNLGDQTSFAMGATLSGANEVPGPGSTEGFGYARVSVNFTTAQLCYRISVANIGSATMAHIHSGAAGVAGPIVFTLNTPVDGLSSGCLTITGTQGADLLNNPGSYYVNVHTGAYPTGALRGQLDPVSYVPGGIVPGGPYVQTVADGLNAVRGLAFDNGGTLYFTDNGAPGEPGSPGCFTTPDPETGEVTELCVTFNGTLWKLADGVKTQVVTGLPGNLNAVVSVDNHFYALVGAGGNPVEMRPIFGDWVKDWAHILTIDMTNNSYSDLADIGNWEVLQNPAGEDIDTNPYGMLAVGDGFMVADAGGNDIIHVDANGVMSTFAVLPPSMAAAPPFLNMPEGAQIPVQAVPTSITQGPDGAFYVSQLTGFPFPVGGASVFRLQDTNGDGDAMDAGEMTVYATGLTSTIDLAFSPSGNLYVLEIAKGGLLDAENSDDPAAATGALVRINSDGSQTEVLSDGLVAPIGMAFASDGSLYIANYGVMPGMGQVLRVTMVE